MTSLQGREGAWGVQRCTHRVHDGAASLRKWWDLRGTRGGTDLDNDGGMVPLIVCIATLFMMRIEHASPGRRFRRVRGWVARAWTVSALQALAVLAFGASFDVWLARHRLFVLDEDALLWPALVGYVAVTLVFYFWHRARHQSELLWRYVHQFHHSPQRIEVITRLLQAPRRDCFLQQRAARERAHLVVWADRTTSSLALTLCGPACCF